MMSGRHLPAGQGMPSDMGRRRPYNPSPQYPPAQMYPYMNQYNANYYPQQYHPQYHNTTPQQYAPYPPYVRSPPPVQHYTSTSMPQETQQSYPRPHPSPAPAAPYQPPLPQTPSTQSLHIIPSPMTPTTPHAGLRLAPSSPTPEESTKIPFRAPLPWFSDPQFPWPARRPRRKRKPATQLSNESIELPITKQSTIETEDQSLAAITIPRPETPSTGQTPSEDNASTNPTTPSSTQKTIPAAGDTTPVAPKASQKTTFPAIPVIPAIPKPANRDSSKTTPEKTAEEAQVSSIQVAEHNASKDLVLVFDDGGIEVAKPTPAPVNPWTKPKAWSSSFNPVMTSSAASGQSARAAVPSFGKTNTEYLAEALRTFDPESKESKVAFLEPRGLVNTGNMCYMNSVLQVLVSCAPFYNFLDQVSKKAVHSFKSDTPLVEAMIMFMREYPIIDSAMSVEQLRLRLKEGELEQYGEAFTPAFVYEVINRLPRFSTMRRGHQQDAEEFLGFLLEGLHDECVRVMETSLSNNTSTLATSINAPSSPIGDAASAPGSGKDDGWQEVGPAKQKPSVTRSSGTNAGSPVTKIFGGILRSELRVPGLQDSVTREPYQPLQLDIGAPNVNNIVDALKGLTRSEALHGDFKSPKGPNVTATKQVFIEVLPPVLILHLKRFQYDNAGGTQKIWKKVGYPLELEIPKEVFARKKRAEYNHIQLPRYRLISVVYHHGKNASGGHYTVDVRRQDGREWIRIDDTAIRRVRSEDVAAAGSEEDPKVLAAALNAMGKHAPSSGNTFAAIEDDEQVGEDNGWKQASGPGKKWSNVVNGTSTPKNKSDKFSVKDNKVAYILFYQKI